VNTWSRINSRQRLKIINATIGSYSAIVYMKYTDAMHKTEKNQIEIDVGILYSCTPRKVVMFQTQPKVLRYPHVLRLPVAREKLDCSAGGCGK
jgi:hypothetical protein